MAIPFVAKITFIFIILAVCCLKLSALLHCTFEADREDEGHGSHASPEDHMVGFDWYGFADIGLFHSTSFSYICHCHCHPVCKLLPIGTITDDNNIAY